MDLQFASSFFFFFFFFVAHKDEPSYFFLRVFSAGLTVTPPSVVLGPANALTFSLRGRGFSSPSWPVSKKPTTNFSLTLMFLIFPLIFETGFFFLRTVLSIRLPRTLGRSASDGDRLAARTAELPMPTDTPRMSGASEASTTRKTERPQRQAGVPIGGDPHSQGLPVSRVQTAPPLTTSGADTVSASLAWAQVCWRVCPPAGAARTSSLGSTRNKQEGVTIGSNGVCGCYLWF